VQRAVEEAVGLLGGIERFVKPGQGVLIKPNVLSGRPPEHGVCTHPEVVRAVIRLAKRVTDKVSVGDSPGGFEVIDLDGIYEITGLKKLCQEEGVKLVKFDSVVKIDGIPFARAVKEADVIINLPKMKTHGLTTLTGAIKNTFGTVVGKYKAESHFRHPNRDAFNLALIKIFSYVSPALNIMDAITAMEGNGPTAGRLRNAGLILASPDAVSLDAVFAGLIGVKPKDINTILHAAKMGLGLSDFSKIEILGSRLDDCRIENFALPEASFIYSAPHWIIRIFGNLIRSYPFINKAVCISCRICEKNCPASAIDIDRHRIDYSKCIYCFCCSELCPKNAVGNRKSLAGNLLNLLIKMRFKWLSRRSNGKITA
jgi:uncharacterized protein (DUF362 family)/Pyruvate/2-oxoacid:ferredoxin oxidoreductase delta subunit